ncbi:MAG: hypothetical protein MZV64_35710 [Ignavibacteriales bacterium]|nr:hypothetical protein [Ignavibacteriales bacterium]
MYRREKVKSEGADYFSCRQPLCSFQGTRRINMRRGILDVKVLLEAAGSLVCARKVTELKKPCDIVASADYFVIDKLLIPEYASLGHKVCNQ